MKNFRDRYKMVDGIPTILPVLGTRLSQDAAWDVYETARKMWHPEPATIEAELDYSAHSDPSWY